MNNNYWKEQLANAFVDLVQLEASAPLDRKQQDALWNAVGYTGYALDLAFGGNFSGLLKGYACTDRSVKLEDLIEIWEFSGPVIEETESKENTDN